MGGEGGAPSVAKEKNCALPLIRVHQNLRSSFHLFKGQRSNGLREQLKVRLALGNGVHRKRDEENRSWVAPNLVKEL